MQTEIDQYLIEQTNLLQQQNSLLAEQNEALSQQVNSLKNIMISYSEVEQSLKNKINTLNLEKEAQHALVIAMKAELSNLEQGEFSEQLQREFQDNLRIQLQMHLTTAFNQLNLKTTVANLVRIELQPVQQTIIEQQSDLRAALSKILQFQPPNLLRRLGDAKQADQYAWGNCRRLNDLNQKLEQLEYLVAKIRIKPKPVTDWQLRFDGYYPGYVRSHQELSAQQQQAYEDNKALWLIEITEQKTEKLLAYMAEARRNIDSSDYVRIEEIIKNDERMLNYLKCDSILSHKNDHLEAHRASYLSCLKNFDEIKERIKAVTSSTHKSSDDTQSRVVHHSYKPELKPKQENNLNVDFDF